MKFAHADDASYEDVGGGVVLHSAPGHPGFPSRLALELFARAQAITGKERVGLWDPLCGAGGIVATVALLRPSALTRVLATDVDPDAVRLAEKNLALIPDAGLLARRGELAARGADPRRLASVDRLRAIPGRSDALRADAATADVTDPTAVAALDLDGIDVVLTDLPYGQQTGWASESGAPADRAPAARALDALRDVLRPGSVVVFSTTARDDLRPLPAATRSFRHGLRHIRMFRLGDAAQPEERASR